MKDNPRVHFAIGLAVIILALKWIFTPTLGDAYLAFTTPPPEDGSVANMDIWAKVAPLFDMIIAFIIAIGAYVIRAGEWLLGKIDSKPKPEPIDKKEYPNVVAEFARAAASGDQPTVSKLQREIRKPYAIQELSRALEKGDNKRAEELFRELEALWK